MTSRVVLGLVVAAAVAAAGCGTETKPSDRPTGEGGTGGRDAQVAEDAKTKSDNKNLGSRAK